MDCTAKILYYDRQNSNGHIFASDCIKNMRADKVPVIHRNDGIRCSIMPGDVLGHADIIRREDGVCADITFNNSDCGKIASNYVDNTDEFGFGFTANKVIKEGNVITSMSIISVDLIPKSRVVTYSEKDGDGDDE